MSYKKKFDEWNTKYKHLSVTAEQYVIITELLEEADEHIKQLKKVKRSVKYVAAANRNEIMFISGGVSGIFISTLFYLVLIRWLL